MTATVLATLDRYCAVCGDKGDVLFSLVRGEPVRARCLHCGPARLPLVLPLVLPARPTRLKAHP